MPLKKNTLFFTSANDAILEGFRPCKMCRPDIRDPHYDPNIQLLIEAKIIMAKIYNTDINLDEIAKKLLLSKRHVMRLFKQYCHLTQMNISSD